MVCPTRGDEEGVGRSRGHCRWTSSILEVCELLFRGDEGSNLGVSNGVDLYFSMTRCYSGPCVSEYDVVKMDDSVNHPATSPSDRSISPSSGSCHPVSLKWMVIHLYVSP